MIKTSKRVHIYLNEYDAQILKEIKEKTKDSQSEIFKLALRNYKNLVMDKKNNE